MSEKENEAEALAKKLDDFNLDGTGSIRVDVACADAASLLRSQAERIRELEKAVTPFAFGDETLEQILYAGMADEELATVRIRLKHVRALRTALRGEKEKA